MGRARSDDEGRYLSQQVAHLKREAQELRAQLEVVRREKEAAADMAKRDVASALQLANEESLKAAGGREVAQLLAIQVQEQENIGFAQFLAMQVDAQEHIWCWPSTVHLHPGHRGGWEVFAFLSPGKCCSGL